MAKDLNRAQFTGNLGSDPEGRYTTSGAFVCSFRVASNRSYTESGGQRREDTEWFRVVAWDKLGEICNQYLTKGTRVYVEGRVQTRKWTDSNGQDRYITEIVAQDMIILSGKGERPAPESSDAPPRAPASHNQPQPIESDEDIPF